MNLTLCRYLSPIHRMRYRLFFLRIDDEASLHPIDIEYKSDSISRWPKPFHNVERIGYRKISNNWTMCHVVKNSLPWKRGENRGKNRATQPL